MFSGGAILVNHRITQCRCQSSPGVQCTARIEPNSLFCREHQFCPRSPMSGSEPVFAPERYNQNPLVQETHNCWAYGMNVLDPAQLSQCVGKGSRCRLMYHQPGGTKRRAGNLHTAGGRSCPTVERLMKLDVPDIRKTTFKARCPRGTSKIAMVVHPGEDYHFFRQDLDGMWSHKDGANKVKRFDAEGLPITDPFTASRNYRPKGSFLNYTDFCGYYCVPRKRMIRLARDE